MDHHQYQTLIKMLEADSTFSPTTLRSKVLLISNVAYVILFGLLAMMVARVMAPASAVVLRMFFIRQLQPEGRHLSAKEAPNVICATAVPSHQIRHH